MQTEFIIHQSGNNQIIEHLTYPKFKALITNEYNTIDIDEIETDEDILDGKDFAIAIELAKDFINQTNEHRTTIQHQSTHIPKS